MPKWRIETQRQWSDLAIERSTPLLLATYSLVALIGHRLACHEPIRIEQTAWYRKTSATFHDVLAAVRRLIWNEGAIPHRGLTLMWDCSLVLCLIASFSLPVFS